MQSNCSLQKNTQVAYPMEGRLVNEETRKYIIMTYGYVITSCSVMPQSSDGFLDGNFCFKDGLGNLTLSWRIFLSQDV